MANEGQRIVIGALHPPIDLNERGDPIRHVFSKPSVPGVAFSTSVVLGKCELRAASYLAASVALNAGTWAQVGIDEEVSDRLDLSFISIGLTNNDKTADLLKDPSNTLIRFDRDRCAFLSKHSGRLLIQGCTAAADHGLILKLRPANHPERTWICCAGLGEWGTSGAAWYLARKWRDLQSKFRDRAFAVIVRVDGCRDESATAVVSAATPEEIERFARD